jgi:hypothetical protein
MSAECAKEITQLALTTQARTAPLGSRELLVPHPARHSPGVCEAHGPPARQQGWVNHGHSSDVHVLCKAAPMAGQPLLFKSGMPLPSTCSEARHCARARMHSNWACTRLVPRRLVPRHRTRVGLSQGGSVESTRATRLGRPKNTTEVLDFSILVSHRAQGLGFTVSPELPTAARCMNTLEHSHNAPAQPRCAKGDVVSAIVRRSSVGSDGAPCHASPRRAPFRHIHPLRVSANVARGSAINTWTAAGTGPTLARCSTIARADSRCSLGAL